MRGLKGSSKTSSKQPAAAGSGSGGGHASARSASHGSSKALVGVVDPPLVDDATKYGVPSPRGAAQPGSGAASPLPTHNAANDPDTPKSRLLHSVMGALEAYASSASDSGPVPHQQQLLMQQQQQQPYHMHHQPSSASSSPARARSDSEDGGYADPALPPRGGATGRPGLPRPPSAARPKNGSGRQHSSGSGSGGRGLSGSGGSSSHLSDSDDGMEREEERLSEQVRALNRSLNRMPMLNMPWAGAPSPPISSAPSPTAFGPPTPPPQHHDGGKPAATNAFRRNALFVNPVLYNPHAMGHHSMGSNSDGEALYYDDYHQPPPVAPATRQQRAEGNPAPVPPGSRSPGKHPAARQHAVHTEEEEEDEDTNKTKTTSKPHLGSAAHRLGGLLLFLSAALVLGGVSGFLLARVALPPPASPLEAAAVPALAKGVGNPSSAQAAAMAAAVQAEEARLRQQQQALKQQQARLAEQQRAQQRLQRELEEEAAAAAAAAAQAAFERRQQGSRAVVLRSKECPCDGIPLLKIILGRFARTVGRLFRFLDKQGKNRGARRRGPVEEAEAAFEF